ncbi:MAG TPA: hypothetical protein VJJ47_01580 [Candidatus Paceibacterota bacterium]
MTQKDLKKFALPDAPGVYLFKKGKGILYIGKATSLKDRVKSYFSIDLLATRGPRIVDMVTMATEIEWQETRSVLEALVVEAALIRKHLPAANVKEKDNRSYYFVALTNEPYPALSLVRGRTLEFLKSAEARAFKKIFGPFPHGTQLREALEIVRRIFPYRGAKCKPCQLQSPTLSGYRPCFSRQIGLCPGCCTGEITPAEYGKTVRRISLLLDGKIGTLERDLERSMKAAAKARRFEDADLLKRQLFALRHIRDASLIKPEELDATSFRVEAYDIAHYSGSQTVGVMTVLEDGWPKKAAYRTFNLRGRHKGDDLAALRELLERRVRHLEWGVPDLVVADGNLQRALAESVFSVNLPEYIKKRSFVNVLVRKPLVVSVVKNERHQVARIDGPKDITLKRKHEILLANSEAHRFAVATLRSRARRESGLKPP